MSEIFDKSSERKPMSSVVEASGLMRSLAEPCPAGDRVKAALGRSIRRMKRWCEANGFEVWTDNRVRDVWLADRRISISSEEMDQLRAAARVKKEADLGDRYQQIIARIERLEEALRQEREEHGGGSSFMGR